MRKEIEQYLPEEELAQATTETESADEVYLVRRLNLISNLYRRDTLEEAAD